MYQLYRLLDFSLYLHCSDIHFKTLKAGHHQLQSWLHTAFDYNKHFK